MNDALRRLDVAQEDEARADLDGASRDAAVDAAQDFVGLHRGHVDLYARHAVRNGAPK